MVARFFDDINYTEAEYAEVQNRKLAEGVIVDVGSELSLSAPGGMFVQVGTGEMMIQGFWFQNPTPVNLPVSGNSSGATRTDAIMVTLNRVTNNATLSIVPNNPAPTRTPGGDWQVRIGTVAVLNGAAGIVPADLTDLRTDVYCGYTGSGVVKGGSSGAAVGVHTPYNKKTGLFFSSAGDQIHVVGQANSGVVVGPTYTFIGTESLNTSVTIGRTGFPTQVLGSLSVAQTSAFTGTSTFTGASTFNGGAVVNTLSILNNINGPNFSILGPAGTHSFVVFQAPVGFASQVLAGDVSGQKMAAFLVAGGAGQGLGGSGDLSIYTYGTGAGGVRIGTAATQRIGLDTTGKIHFGNGNVVGSGRWNFFQTGNGMGEGIRLHNPNTSFYLDMQVQGNGWAQLSMNGAFGHILLEPAARGAVVIGTTASALGKLHLYQAAGTSSEGYYQSFGGGIIRMFSDPSGHYNIQSASTNLILHHGAAQFSPLVDQGAHLGTPSLRWANFYCVAMTCSTTAVFSGAVTMQSTLSINGTLSGITSLSMAGALSGATTGNFSGTVTAGNFSTAGNPNLGNDATATRFIANLRVLPDADNGANCGESGRMWSEVWTYLAFKPGGGDWGVVSDDRTKHSDFRPFNDGLATLLLLNPVHYRYNGLYGMPSDQEFVGFRAQEVQAVAPDMVGVVAAKRTGADDEEEEDILTVDTSLLNYLFVNAVKELHGRIEALERQLAERKN